MRWIEEGKITTTQRGNRHMISTEEAARFIQWYTDEVTLADADAALWDLFGEYEPKDTTATTTEQ